MLLQLADVERLDASACASGSGRTSAWAGNASVGSAQQVVPRAEHSAVLVQADINEVNKTAHTIKSRLEALDNANKKAITQPVRATLLEPAAPC